MSREKILQIIKNKGPIIPSQISKDLGTNILFTSAMLSELVERKELRVSNLKIGGSPLYYIPGQETFLERFIDKLNEKDKFAYSLIKEKKLLRDKEETPINRVALRAIKDFAIPLEVSFNNRKEIFWRWYGLDNKEAEEKIKLILNSELQKEQTKQPISGLTKDIGGGVEEIKGKETKLKKESILKPKLKIETKKENFLQKLENFIKKSNLNIKERSSKTDGVLEVNTPIGTINLFYMIKIKRTITEKDIGEALAKSQMRNLAVIIFSDGDLNRKATDMLDKFRNIYYKKIEA